MTIPLRLLGALLIVAAIYFIGDDIVFAGPKYGIAGGTAVVLFAVGVWLAMGMNSPFNWIGWACILAGIGIIFYFSRVFFKPTTLRDLLAAMACLILGLRLLMPGRVIVFRV